MKKLFFTLNWSCAIALFVFSCTKDKARPLGSGTPGVASITPLSDKFDCEDTAFNWAKLPEEPAFGWMYQQSNGKNFPWRVLYDLKDKDVIYFTTVETSGSQKLWKLNRSTNLKTLLDEQVLINLDISKTGWLLYEKIDKNIYKIKTNGDSLTQLTTKGSYLFPSWSEDGRFIFYFDDRSGKPGKSIIQARNDGTVLDTLENVGEAAMIYNKKNFLYYIDFDGELYTMMQLDLNTQKSRKIISKERDSDIGMWSYFFTDNENRELYWFNYSGLYKVDLSTLVSKKVINGGYHSLNNILHYRQSPVSRRFIAVQFNTEIVNAHTLKTWNNLIEYSEDGRCRRVITIPD